MKKALVIINPKAGKTRSKSVLFDIVTELCQNEYQVCVQTTMFAGHARSLAENASRQGIDLIVVAGGDGTLNETASGVMLSQRQTPIGYIPCGSTNDFAMSTGISLNMKKAVKDAVYGEDYNLDIGKFGDRYFTYVASFGAFTSVSYKTSQASKNALGHFAYIIEGIKDFGNVNPYNVKIEADGKVIEGTYCFGAVGNSKSIGGLIKLKEELVSVTDGEFEVILIKPPKNPAELGAIIHGLTFSDFKDQMFEFFKASKIKITTEDTFDWTLDGEFAEGAKEIEILNLNGKLTIRKGTS